MTQIKNREKYLKENPFGWDIYVFIIALILFFAVMLYSFKDHYIDTNTGNNYIKK